jgi:hypothetical protein
MSIYRAISRLKSSIFSKKAVGLSSVLTENVLRRNLYLRPCTAQQRLHMLEGYLKAAKYHYPNGGHIFVGSHLAAEVLHYLDASLISYTVHSLVEMNAHLDIMPVVDQAEGVVRVFVEDDHLSYAARDERFLKVQALFSPQCVPMIPLPPDELEDMKAHFEKVSEIQARIKRLRRFVLFYEMNTTFEKSFPIVMCQLKGRVGYCIMSTQNDYEREIQNLQRGEQDEPITKEILVANTVQVYGAGPKHKREILGLKRQYFNAEGLDIIANKGFFTKTDDTHGFCILENDPVELILNE